MKVLLVGKSGNLGGAAIASYRLTEVLRENRVDATLLVQEGDGDGECVVSTTRSAPKRWINFLRFAMERLFFLRHEKNRDVRFLFSLANTGERLTKNTLVGEADLIHLHWVNGGFLSFASLKALMDLGKPVVWTFHDMWAFTGGCHHALNCDRYKQECGSCPYLKKPGKNDLSHRLWLKKRDLFRNRNMTVITPSMWLHERVKESSLLGGSEVHTIHNVVDQKQFIPLEREQACGKLGLDPSKKYILFGAASVQNLYKGFNYFQDAITQLSKDPELEGGVEIILFGKNSGEVSEMFPLETHSFNFVDSMQTMAALYSVAHLYVISSLQETLPTTLMESMFCGTPVVGFRTGGIPEMITHLKDGYLAEHKNASDLSRGMLWALSFKLYQSLRDMVRNEALRKFSRERSAEKHMEIYRNVLKKVHP